MTKKPTSALVSKPHKKRLKELNWFSLLKKTEAAEITLLSELGRLESQKTLKWYKAKLNLEIGVGVRQIQPWNAMEAFHPKNNNKKDFNNPLG